jgi:hypothetical protein
MGLAAPLCISVTPEELSYADHVAGVEKISRSDVYRRGLRALKKARHDYTGPLQSMMFLADEMERHLLGRHEVAGRIRELVGQMDAMRESSAG